MPRALLASVLRIAIAGVLLVVLGAITARGYQFFRELQAAEGERDSVRAEAQKLEKENVYLREDLEYYANPDNLEKKARELLNVKSPGQQTIIVIPNNR
jgi:cell division protein FtsB